MGIEALVIHAYREKKVERLGAGTRRILGIRGPFLRRRLALRERVVS